jgi:threonine synthase
MPIGEGARIITLGEGHTPLVRLRNLTAALGAEIEIYVKFEGLNPTGSFKDRGMTVAVTRAVEAGARAIICASTGNTSAAAAAYAARAGLTAFVLIPEGKIALGKLAQAMMHGAVVIQIRGNFDAGMELVRELGQNTPVSIVNSINPYRIQGQKTAAFEIVDDLGRAPDYHCLPVGNAGNITAYWLGYNEYHHHGPSPNLPRMVGYQAAGAAPFVLGAPMDEPETVATAIRIGRPQSWDGAMRANRESGGWFSALTDDEILAAQRLLAAQEGVFCEPASAVSIAGALRDIREGRIERGSLVVCTLTGHGLKDPDIAIRQSPELQSVEATRAAVREVILDNLRD